MPISRRIGPGIRTQRCLRRAAVTIVALAGLAPGARAEAKASYIGFAVTGATWTVPLAINASGTVTGYAVIGNDQKGFIRAIDGSIKTFGIAASTFTWPSCINRHGAVTGYYLHRSWGRGFLRSTTGAITRFNVEGARGTQADCINDSGVITGYYFENRFHGVVRAADGTMTSFDPPESIATDPTVINTKGDIAGWFISRDGNQPGFLRHADGHIDTFVVNNLYTIVYGINEKRFTVGSFGSGGNVTGFLRAPNGTITTIDHEGFKESSAQAVNNVGAVVGYCQINQVNHGFIRSPDGKYTIFDRPGASDTQPYAINDDGVVTGEYWDNGARGFIRTP